MRRSAVLLGGFLEIAAETGLPLRLLELGASAGLNNIWDQYRYRLGEEDWGRPTAEPLIETEWSGPRVRLDTRIEVVERAACDLAPVDLNQQAARLRLESFIWPDQPERRQRFRQAATRVRQAGIQIDRSAALSWLESRLAEAAPGCATVIFHSIFWQYVSPVEQRGIEALIAKIGASARRSAPLAWLRMEHRSRESCELNLSLWPAMGAHAEADAERLLARCGFHGEFVEWFCAARD